MRNWLCLIICVAVISCLSPKSLLKKGRYDEAIDKCIKHLERNPNRNSDAIILDSSYTLANNRSFDSINLLKLQDNPANWERIYQLYMALDSRQQRIQAIVPLNLRGQQIWYDLADYTPQIEEARQGTSNYYYYIGSEYLKETNMFFARKAYYAFLKAEEFAPTLHPDINTLLNTAKDLGTSHVLITIENNTIANINSQTAIEWVLNHVEFSKDEDTDPKNVNWLQFYYGKETIGHKFDFKVEFVVDQINVSTPYEDVREYTQNRQVEDGVEKARDKNGNVKKDSSGREITVKKYKTISCTVVETCQNKHAEMYGYSNIFDTNAQAVVYTEKLSAFNKYEYRSAKIYGDINALNPQTRQRIAFYSQFTGIYPSDFQMIDNCTTEMFSRMASFLKSNVKYIGGN